MVYLCIYAALFIGASCIYFIGRNCFPRVELYVASRLSRIARETPPPRSLPSCRGGVWWRHGSFCFGTLSDFMVPSIFGVLSDFHVS